MVYKWLRILTVTAPLPTWDLGFAALAAISSCLGSVTKRSTRKWPLHLQVWGRVRSCYIVLYRSLTSSPWDPWGNSLLEGPFRAKQLVTEWPLGAIGIWLRPNLHQENKRTLRQITRRTQWQIPHGVSEVSLLPLQVLSRERRLQGTSTRVFLNGCTTCGRTELISM